MQLALANAVNAEPLPLIGEGYGIRLPPRSQRLTATSFNVVPNAPPLHDDLDDDEPPAPSAPPAPPVTANAEEIQDEGPAEPPSAGRVLEEESDYDMDEDGPAGASPPARSPVPPPPAPPAPSAESRGVKRQLEEDEDYD